MKLINKNLFVIFLTICCQVSFAANIKIKHFRELTQDLSNRTEVKRDINDVPCAIIKVINGDASFVFEGAIVDKVYKAGEIWLYVSPGIKRITIKHGSAALRYEFPVHVDYAVYELALKSAEDSNKVGAIATSFFLPGVGQMAFKNDKLKGGLILGGEVLSIGGVVGCALMQNSYRDKANLAIEATDKIDLMKKSDNCGTARNVMIGVVAAIWAYNFIDVIVAPKKGKIETIALSPYIDVTPQSNVYGVNMAIKF